MPITTNVINAKQLVELLTPSVIDDDALYTYSVCVDDARFGTRQWVTNITIEASVGTDGKVKRTVMLTTGEREYEGY